MSLEPVLIAGEWRAAKNPAGTFQAVNPSTKTPLTATYPVSSLDDVLLAFRAAEEAVAALVSIVAVVVPS